MSYHEYLTCHGISVSGLNPADQQRIEEIGLNKWLDEVTGATESQPMPKEKAKPKKGQRKISVAQQITETACK